MLTAIILVLLLISFFFRMGSATVGAASVAAAVATVVALAGIAVIVRDIDDMRSEIETSMKEVKVRK
ncbi:hypothetical protein Y032_1030g3440 [Ancylostoma ceylanicum]|uniref:Nematode cuticle collagen N-terminal domain-containing protein n=1 Tax=Ancylostoma ceylanicum TaxID=53326 RepID=A0A016W9A2_9BILA|nr:hypothetical protein Y032_1030g3440 [Ancylostoma ceylanicum]